MAITKLPPGFKLPESLVCAICGVRLSLDLATAGLFDAQGKQAFACVSHFSEPELLIRGWALFVASERIKYLQKGAKPDELIYGEHGYV